MITYFDFPLYDSHNNYVETAMTSVGMTVTRRDQDEPQTITQVLTFLNAGNDAAMLNGHGTPIDILCCPQPFYIGLHTRNSS